jgi:hypothetical protein
MLVKPKVIVKVLNPMRPYENLHILIHAEMYYI